MHDFGENLELNVDTRAPTSVQYAHGMGFSKGISGCYSYIPRLRSDSFRLCLYEGSGEYNVMLGRFARKGYQD